MKEQEKPEDPVVMGCGRQLRRTREKLGLSLDDVAGELRLSSFQIQALEDDDWSQLPGTTYARGYLRSYARLIGLDADQLMTGASTQEIEISRREPEIPVRKSAAPEADGDEPAAESSGGSGWRWVAVLGVAAVIAMGFWQYRETGRLAPGTTETEEAGMAESSDGSLSEEIAREEAERSAATQVAAGESAPMPTVPGKAVFQFEDRSWIEVRDASGERLVYRDIPPGRRIEVEGQPPFRVYLGNASAVQVEYMGNVVTPGTESGRLYARFVLGAPSG